MGFHASQQQLRNRLEAEKFLSLRMESRKTNKERTKGAGRDWQFEEHRGA